MSWAKMCACFPCCRKKISDQPSSTITPANSANDLDAPASSPPLLIRPAHHKYTSTLVDIRGALSTPIAP